MNEPEAKQPDSEVESLRTRLKWAQAAAERWCLEAGEKDKKLKAARKRGNAWCAIAWAAIAILAVMTAVVR